MSELTFTPGQRVRCINAEGFYHLLTEGREYTVTAFEEEHQSGADSSFTWPAYVVVTGDKDIPVHCHAHRFRPANMRTRNDCEVSFAGRTFTVPAGSPVFWVIGPGGGYALADQMQVAALSGSAHDATYRWCWIPADNVTHD